MWPRSGGKIPLDRFAGAPTTPETVRQQTNIRIIDVLVSALVYAGRSSVLADRPAQHSILWELPASCRVKKQEKTPGFGLTALQRDGVLRLVFLLDVWAKPGIIVCVDAPPRLSADRADGRAPRLIPGGCCRKAAMQVTYSRGVSYTDRFFSTAPRQR